ncbi:MAG: PfaB family protein [Anaerolineae bacterium]|nr:PfaB family protein [Anaerolineae bacterium]
MTMSAYHDKIAIIGVACLFPGASTPQEFWQNLVEGKNVTSAASATEFRELYYDPAKQRRDTSYFTRGGYVRQFDPNNPLDRAFQWSLYVAEEALKDSGYRQRGDLLARTGLILGNLSFPTRDSHQLFASLYDQPMTEAIAALLDRPVTLNNVTDTRQVDLLNALTAGLPAAYVSQRIGLGVTEFAIDAACASSLYAMGLACDYLGAGKADLMLAGAVSAADPLFVNMGFTNFGAYPDKNDSRPLDSNSGGLISGEGAGMFVLKRYSDALRDGDRIYAVITGVGLANDGRGKHPLTPNPRGQILAFQRAYANGDLDPALVQYVECHASGTPLGDKTEINSLDDFFGGRGSKAPLIGSVKSNMGHLLTTAGMASMLKVILSMHHGLIPATIGVTQPLTSQNHTFGTGQIVAQNTPWAVDNRIAGVNAFGFGGVSAHLVLTQSAQPYPTPAYRPAKLAVIGMDAHFGPVEGVKAFAQTIYNGTQHFIPLPPKRWKGMHTAEAPLGAYIDSFDVDFMRFKVPPKEDDQPIPQQLLLLKVADQAVQDAGLHEGDNVAVIVAVGTELSLHQYRGRLDLSWKLPDALAQSGIALPHEQYDALEGIAKDALNPPAQVNQYTSAIGNIVSSRVSALWNFSGPAFTLSSEENSTFKALEVAGLLLADDAIDAVVIGAVDLAGGLESVMLRRELHPINSGTQTLSFDQNVNGWMVGEGAGAIVLKRADRVRKEDQVYAVIDSVALVKGGDTAIEQAAGRAMSEAQITVDQIGYVEAHGSGITEEDRAEIIGLNRVYRGQREHIAIGSIKANIGNTFAASGMASLIKSILCLYYRMIPQTPNWSTPKQADMWSETFYVPQESRTWISNGRRYAAINGLGIDGTAAHVILSEGTHHRDLDYLQSKPLQLILIDGDTKAGLMGRLGQMETALNEGNALPILARRAFNVYRNRSFVLALVSKDRDGLRKEIEAAKKALMQADEWQTPAGSYFTANPVGQDGGIAFVYPGAFNSYPGLGQEWLHLFPTAHDHLLSITQDAVSSVADPFLYQRSLAAPSRAEVRAFRARIAEDQAAMMASGTTFAVLFTYVMREVFKIKPTSAFGYSIGEGSMLWAMGVWYEGDKGNQRLLNSELFKTRLYGRKQAVREMWGLPESASDDFWASYVLTTSMDKVITALSGEARVYLTHVNTPNETVIAGDPVACERVIAKIGCNSLRAPFEVVIHNEAMISEYHQFYELHHYAVNPAVQAQNVTFYSAADYLPIQLNSEVIARNVARVSCKTVDFPRLIQRAYQDGARIFIELGPGSTCARWVSDTLADHPHLAVSIDNLRADDHTALIKMLARLASHRVSMDLAPLYQDLNTESADRKSLLKSITLGGERIEEVIVTDHNRRRISGATERTLSSERAIPASGGVTSPAMYGTETHTSTTPAMYGTEAHTSTPLSMYGEASGVRSRLDSLREIGAAIAAQLQAPHEVTIMPPTPVKPTPPPATNRFTPSRAIFDTVKIDQFARLRIADCFGEEYAIYDHKRAPRIPNTDLMLVSRAIQLNATRLITKAGSSLVMEYDVPADMWFYGDNSYPIAPYSMLMEMALQPCGFLSAYMGPTFDFPDIDFYFRNLDGVGHLTEDVDLRGRTLTNRVELVSSTTLQGIIIQKYLFDMTLDGKSFYTGNSTFGYFTLQALSSQAGLDMGKPPAKWHEANPAHPLTALKGNRAGQMLDDSGYMNLPQGQLAFVDDLQLTLNGGSKGLGYVWATSNVDPRDWFFKCHFHQDPVMPGSLGLETITQAIQAYAIQANLGKGFKQPRFANAEDHKMIWKYRGQVLSDSKLINVEVDITGIERKGDQLVITANASLWKGALRIYEFKNVAIAIEEG